MKIPLASGVGRGMGPLALTLQSSQAFADSPALALVGHATSRLGLFTFTAMSIHNPKMSLENQANELERLLTEYCERRKFKGKRTRSIMGRSYKWQKFQGGEKIGEPFEATVKEIKLMEKKADYDFTKRLSKYKGIGPRPRLETWTTVTAPKPEKKLWES